MKLKRLFLLIFSLLIVIGAVLGFNIYNKIYTPNTDKEGFLYIPTNSTFQEVEGLVRPFLKKVKPFIWVAHKKKYQHAIKPGRYHIAVGMNNNELVDLLRSGKQSIVKLSFNNQHSFEKLAGRIANQIEADSISLLNSFKDQQFIMEAGFTDKTALNMYIPNTYEFYWNTQAEDFRKKMLTEFNKFWNNSRMEKAKNLNLSASEVMILASVVQKETALINERPIVARLYLNRLNAKWPLQADPTIIYALKKKYGSDFTVKRVLTKDLTIDSPYNTYTHIGLPPGPISMSDISSINAVLNPADHDYYYMCASVTSIGKHEFAKTLAQHNKNAAKYQRWISQQGINR
jgi:UPF0755 protein